MAESDVLDVVDRLVEQDADVRVVQRVDDPPALPLADDEAEMAQEAQQFIRSWTTGIDRL